MSSFQKTKGPSNSLVVGWRCRISLWGGGEVDFGAYLVDGQQRAGGGTWLVDLLSENCHFALLSCLDQHHLLNIDIMGLFCCCCFTSVPKKSQRSFRAPVVSGSTRPLLYTPPSACHPAPIATQDVTPPTHTHVCHPLWLVPSQMSPQCDLSPPTLMSPLSLVIPVTDVNPPPRADHSGSIIFTPSLVFGKVSIRGNQRPFNADTEPFAHWEGIAWNDFNCIWFVCDLQPSTFVTQEPREMLLCPC